MEAKESIESIETNKNRSYFDGGVLANLGYGLLCAAITAITFGICHPWAFCIKKEWRTRHTVVDGRRLVFDGTGAQLFGNWIKWLLLMFVTIGIYSLWVSVKMMQWEAKHTHFVED